MARSELKVAGAYFGTRQLSRPCIFANVCSWHLYSSHRAAHFLQFALQEPVHYRLAQVNLILLRRAHGRQSLLIRGGVARVYSPVFAGHFRARGKRVEAAGWTSLCFLGGQMIGRLRMKTNRLLGVALVGLHMVSGLGCRVPGDNAKLHSLTYQHSRASVITGGITTGPLGGIEIETGRILREVQEPVEGLTRTEVEYELHGKRLSATVMAHAFENDSRVLGYQKFLVKFSDGTELDMCRKRPMTLEEAKAEAAKPPPARAVGRT